MMTRSVCRQGLFDAIIAGVRAASNDKNEPTRIKLASTLAPHDTGNRNVLRIPGNPVKSVFLLRLIFSSLASKGMPVD